MTDRAKGTLCGLLGASLFGASAPLAKLLLSTTGPLALAGLLYLGAGIGVTLVRAARTRSAEAPLRRSDFGLLAGVILLGGIVGPVLLFTGIQRLSAGSASLLLNLEALFTIFVAAAFFREHIGRRAWLATVVILSGSVLLAYRPDDLHGGWLGALAVAGACLCWGMDNNLTQRLSVRDPLAIVQWKTLTAGSCSTVLALATGQTFPRPTLLVCALVLGVFSYGVSVLLDVYALRLLGAAREAALFATAPFVGALWAIPLLGEWPRLLGVVAMVLMAVGAWSLVREKHGHVHSHEPDAHDHIHTHDEHHQHEHAPGTDLRQPHSHHHQHAPLTHEHAHAPDLHHRHKHHS